MCNDTKSNKHLGASPKLCTLAQFAQVAHDQICHVLQEVDFIVADTVPRFVVKNTVGPDASAAWRLDWDASIEACVGSLFYIRPITKPLVFEEIVNNMNFTSVIVVAIGSFVSFWNVDGVLTN